MSSSPRLALPDLPPAPPLLEGIESLQVTTERTRTQVLRRAGSDPDGPLVLLVHGNASSARFYEELMVALPPEFSCLAPDLRGFGGSRPDPVDATRGLRDFSDDLGALLEHGGLSAPQRLHLVGWSLGGGVVMQLAIDRPQLVASVTLLASMSPYGFGGTRGADGTPCFEDGAGSGAGAVAPEFVARLRAKDRGSDSPLSPRAVMRASYFAAGFAPAPEREAVYLEEMLAMAVGDDHYPGDVAGSANWPGFAPGTRGVLNAASARWCDLSAFATVAGSFPVLYVHGDRDAVVADDSRLELGTLGSIGAVPGWPGADTYPPQPMVGQLRGVLRRAEAAGGRVVEALLDRCGHSPHLERPDEVRELLATFVTEAERCAPPAPAAAAAAAPAPAAAT